jgi:ElaB/YqjD/DUF883 family membrane-anchored ribosome-binding protein
MQGNIMDEQKDPQNAGNTPDDTGSGIPDDFKAAAAAKAAEIRRVAEKKAEELRQLAQAKAQELGGAAESAWSDARTKAKSWHAGSETYVRENPTKAILIALGLGFLLGLLFRK